MLRALYPLLLLFLSACAELPGQGLFGEASGIGVVEAMTGDPLVFRGNSPFHVEVGVLVEVRDIVRTGEADAIRLRLADGSRLALGANAELVLLEYSNDAPKQARLSLSQGSMRVLIKDFLRREGSSFVVLSPLATVEPAAGDFWMGDLFADDQLDVVLLTPGELEISNAFGRAVLMEEKQGTTVIFGRVPGEPEAWPEEEIESVLESTRLPEEE